MCVTTAGIRLTTTVGGEIRRTPPVTVTTATRFVNCSAGGQKRIRREACGGSPIAKVTSVGYAGSLERPFKGCSLVLLSKQPPETDSLGATLDASFHLTPLPPGLADHSCYLYVT